MPYIVQRLIPILFDLQLTDAGGALQATLQGTKFWGDKNVIFPGTPAIKGAKCLH